MVGFYLLVLIFIVLVAIGGYDGTMRLIQYADLNVRYAIIQVRMYFMRKKLEKHLGINRRDNDHV